MKILNVITSMRMGGAEKLLSEMLPIMQEKGVKVDLLVFDGVETPLMKSMNENGINVYAFGKNVNVYSPQFIFKIIPFLKKYDIIHAHNTACQLFVAIASLFVNKKERPVLVTTEHSTTNRRRNKPLLKWIDRWMYARYNHIVAVSRKVKENLIHSLGQHAPHIHIIFNGICLRDYKKDYSLQLKKSADEVVLTMVAAFRKGKDQMTLIRTVAELPDNYNLYLVGDGEQKEVNVELAHNLGVQERVHFMGIRSDVPAILKASDVVLMSSEFEGLSLSSVEGLASGRPVLASDVDGLHEIVGGAGILFELGNEKQLAAKIQNVMDDKELYNKTVEQCLERAAKFDAEVMTDNYLRLYGASL